MTTPIDKFLQKCANQSTRKDEMIRIAVEAMIPTPEEEIAVCE